MPGTEGREVEKWWGAPRRKGPAACVCVCVAGRIAVKGGEPLAGMGVLELSEHAGPPP